MRRQPNEGSFLRHEVTSGSYRETSPLLNSASTTEDNSHASDNSDRETSVSVFGNRVTITWCRTFSVPLSLFTVFLAIAFVTALLVRGICQPAYLNSLFLLYNETQSENLYVSVLFFSLSRLVVAVGILFIAFLGNYKDINLRSRLRKSRLALIGFVNFLSFLFIFYGGPPTRTPPQLQAVLVTSAVPFGVLVYRVADKKWESKGRLACAFIAVVGLFISLVPVIFKLPKAQDAFCGNYSTNASSTESHGDPWCAAYALSFLAGSIMIVLAHKEMKYAGLTNVQLPVLMAWICFFIALFTVCFFWINFFPEPVGTVQYSFTKLGEQIRKGLACWYGLEIGQDNDPDPRCQEASLWGWGTVLSSYTLSLCFFAVTKYAANPVLSLIVQSIATPVLALFWMLFVLCPEKTDIKWFLSLTKDWQSTICVVVGVLIIVPAAVGYKVLRKKGTSSINR